MQIEKTYTLPFPVDAIYAAWVSSDTVIPPATQMDIKPVVGGHYRLIIETPEFTGRNEGRFKVVEPCQRLVYTWRWNDDEEVTEIEVKFLASVEGTEIQLTHSGFLTDESAHNHDTGWDSYMEGFVAFLGQD